MIGEGIPLLLKGRIVDIFTTTYLPRLVNVVCERPLRGDIIRHFVPKGLTFLQKKKGFIFLILYSLFLSSLYNYFFFLQAGYKTKNPYPWEPLENEAP